jgi:hypothetical protein
MSDTREFLDFVFDNESDEITYYSHRTDNKKTAEQIMKEGLHFSDSFQKTTDLLLNDPIHIRYWKNLRKEYGPITVIIGISTNMMRIYQNLLNRTTNKNFEVQQILTEKDPFDLEDVDEVYTVPVQFIKGYWDDTKGTIHNNKKFDPHFDSPIFKRNIDNLIERL